MKKLISLFFTILTISVGILYTGCEQSTDLFENPVITTSGEQSLDKAFQSRPFTGEFVYTFISQVNDSISVYYGTGTATHWGYCTIIDTVIHHYTQTGLTVDGKDWVTVASGNLVHMTWFMDYYDPSTWTWELVSGNGRFDGVTGGGTYIAEITSSGDLWVRFTGTITY